MALAANDSFQRASYDLNDGREAKMLLGNRDDKRTAGMFETCGLIIVGLVVSMSVLQPVSRAAQRAPDFSGNWVLVEAVDSGPSRGSSEKSAATITDIDRINTVSGAAFNCGRRCTITHKGQSLVVENAQLRERPGQDEAHRTPAVTLRLDGREVAVVYSYSTTPDRTIPVTAKWEGNKLQIDSNRSDPFATTQTVSLEGTQLVVVSVTLLKGERHSETRFKYDRK
jgi:hypothetical protein